MSFPDPTKRHPVILPDGTEHLGTVFLSAVVRQSNFVVGEYTYASAFHPPDDWAQRLAPYLFESSPERLNIGKFCQIADRATFITSSANHRYDGVSSYPFAIFDGGAADDRPSLPGPGLDTHVGHDVWIGQGAQTLPGANIGDGAIIGAGSVVAGTVPPYAIVVGNPGRVIRMRFSPQDVARLQSASWWHWPIEKILAHETEICGVDVDAICALLP